MTASRFLFLLLISSAAQSALSQSASAQTALTQATPLKVLTSQRVAGPAGVRALQAMPDGAALLCLGQRLVKLDAQGKLLQAAALTEPCRDLSLSPDGKTLLVTGQSVTLRDSADLKLIQSWPDAQGGFLANTDVLLRAGSKLSRLNVISGTRETLTGPVINSLVVAPDGKRAVISDGQRVQLVSLPDFAVQSASRCSEACTVQNAHFNADGRVAVALAGRTLLGLRDGMPASTVMRDTDAAVGLPQPNNTVLTFSGAGVESRDFQTGRPERTLLQEVQASPALALQTGGRILALGAAGELLDTAPDWKTVRRTPLPALVQAGGLDAAGNIYALSGGILTLGDKKLPGTYWALQTMNKTTWALRSDGEGGLQVGTLSGEKFSGMPGSPGSATHLSVNHWGNHAAVWDDETLWVVSQPKNKVISTVNLSSKPSGVTVSPDATRAYVFPASGDAYVVTLANGKRAPLAVSGRFDNLQISGKGAQALAHPDGKISLYAPSTQQDSTQQDSAKQATATLAAIQADQAQQARFSPDNKWLALPVLGDQGAKIDLINAETGRVEASTPPLASLPTFLTWSVDSKKLAVGASLLTELASVTVFEVR